MKIFFNFSMLNKKPTGVGVYCEQLYGYIKSNLEYKSLFISDAKFLTIRRLFWNLFVLPFKIKKNLVYSPSTHGSIFIKNQIITIHDLIALNFPTQYKFQYYYFKYYVPLLIKYSKKVVAISSFTKSELISYYGIKPDKIEVIHNGIVPLKYEVTDLTKLELKKIVGDSKFFVCVGASYSHKNILTLIDSIAHFGNKDVKFVIVGKNNDYFNGVKEKAKFLNLDNVIFLNYISNELLQILYERALANIYVSLYEGFGYPPLEAAQLGTISIVSDIPIMREVYGESMLFVDPTSVEKISNYLTQIVKQPYDKKEIYARTNYLFSLYSWEKTINSINNLINSVK